MQFFKSAVLIGFLFIQPTWAECVYLPKKTCTQIQITKILQKGKAQICIAKTEHQASDGTSETRNVFFKACPIPGAHMTGDLIQRPDMTPEGLGTCEYEFHPNKEQIREPEIDREDLGTAGFGGDGGPRGMTAGHRERGLRRFG